MPCVSLLLRPVKSTEPLLDQSGPWQDERSPKPKKLMSQWLDLAGLSQ